MVLVQLQRTGSISVHFKWLSTVSTETTAAVHTFACLEGRWVSLLPKLDRRGVARIRTGGHCSRRVWKNFPLSGHNARTDKPHR